MTDALIVIVGTTASGKTALALELAEKFGGEVICADSRTVYRGMDIGTAKPTLEEQERVAHHLIDVVDPNERFSAAQFKEQAIAAIADIHSRGKLPILVGGTGLYIDAVIFDFQFVEIKDESLRQTLEQLSVEELQREITRLGYVMPENSKNKRYLVRTIERHGETGSKRELRPNTVAIGIAASREVIRQRIENRVEAMFAEGFVDEAKSLVRAFGETAPAFLAPGYKAVIPYLRGEISIEQAKADFVKNDYHLAKRQETWFKRNKSIQWVNDRSEGVDLVTTFLNN